MAHCSHERVDFAENRDNDDDNNTVKECHVFLQQLRPRFVVTAIVCLIVVSWPANGHESEKVDFYLNWLVVEVYTRRQPPYK